jgi:hypothetical protein
LIVVNEDMARTMRRISAAMESLGHKAPVVGETKNDEALELIAKCLESLVAELVFKPGS